ncbi:MAG: LexA family protein [Rhodothermales bacterium]
MHALHRLPSPNGVRLLHPLRLHKGPHRPLPLIAWRICAGFPSPADDHLDNPLDLNDLIIARPASTFLMRVQGRSMEGAGIHDGDLVVVDRSLQAKDGDVVVAIVNGELTLKRVCRARGRLFLMPENDAYEAIAVTREMDFDVWGVVTYAVHRVE